MARVAIRARHGEAGDVEAAHGPTAEQILRISPADQERGKPHHHHARPKHPYCTRRAGCAGLPHTDDQIKQRNKAGDAEQHESYTQPYRIE